MNKDKLIQVRFTEELYDKVKKQSDEEERSMGMMVRRIVREYYENKEMQ